MKYAIRALKPEEQFPEQPEYQLGVFKADPARDPIAGISSRQLVEVEVVYDGSPQAHYSGDNDSISEFIDAGFRDLDGRDDGSKGIDLYLVYRINEEWCYRMAFHADRVEHICDGDIGPSIHQQQ